MYGKLAWRNMRRSLRDYGIYFMTLVFAVAIFYASNTLGDQPAFQDLGASTRRMAQGALTAVEWLTTIMSGVVALLVLYANRVIVKKRSQELGTYLLLGMEQGRLALLLLVEVAVIGLAALGVGLLGGILLSQLFALGVGRLFAADLQPYTFLFSPGAAGRTLLVYGLIFLAVGLWQAAAIYRQKLIDLITGVRKNEEIRLRSRPLSVVAGLASLLTLGPAYWLSDQVSRDAAVSPRDLRILLGAAMGVVGTYLLFLALAGLLTGVRRRHGGWTARGLNLFLYRQVTSKINTNAALLATIALMLTFTICAMSTGLGLGQIVRQEAEREAPFDYALFSTDPTEGFEGFLDLFDQHGLTDRRAIRFTTAQSPLRTRELMLPADAAGVADGIGDLPLRIIPYSAYQELRAMKGYSAVELPEDGFLIHASDGVEYGLQQVRQAFGRFQASGSGVAVAGRSLRPVTGQVFAELLGYWLVGGQSLLVVPDQVAVGLEANRSYLHVQVAGRIPAALDEAVEGWAREAGTEGQFLAVISRSATVGRVYLFEGIMVFLSFYVGVMFILISATLLALQQVTDAVEHRQRFEVLRKLGADDPMIDRTIAKQVGLYFLTPVAVAVLHSLVAVTALARLLRIVSGYTTVWPAALATLGIFTLIYGAYYLLSLQSCRALFKQQQA